MFRLLIGWLVVLPIDLEYLLAVHVSFFLNCGEGAGVRGQYSKEGRGWGSPVRGPL